MIVIVFMIYAASVLAQVPLKKLSLRQNSHADILLGSSNLWGIGMGKTCKPKAVSFQCMTKFTTKKKKIAVR